MGSNLAIDDIIKASSIVFGLIHFIAGFLLYRDVIRINRVVRTKLRASIKIWVNFYILFLLGVLILFIVI